MPSVLFVCLGNICRSPAAEGVFRAMAAGSEWQADSAGTSGWHVGDPPYGPMQAAARARGYDLSGLRGRGLVAEDHRRFDLILGMDGDNLEKIRALAPDGARAKTALFLEFAPEAGLTEVPDPYYTRDYEQALDLIEAGCRGLSNSLTRS